MPFMFLSAFSDEETVAQVKALGAVAYLVKPLDIRQIVPAVEAAFADLRAGAVGSARTAGAAARTRPELRRQRETSSAIVGSCRALARFKSGRFAPKMRRPPGRRSSVDRVASTWAPSLPIIEKVTA